MRDYLTLGPTPAGEQCENLGPNYNPQRARLECNTFRDQLRREFPEATCQFVVKSFPHDFGSYMEVCAVYDDTDEVQVDWAFRAESDTPEYWDQESRELLGLA